ncbi:MAG: NADPH-dependent assimilatory sulfite reductase hemoprotein subunit [Alphaproteobacteria bacterium]
MPDDAPAIRLSPNERIKRESRHLRGTIAQGLADAVTGALADDDTQLTKFHGIYQQDDRDLRAERRRKKLEPAYSFMARVRIPGGVLTPAQWLSLDRIAGAHANGTIRLTTRQAVQFHGIIKSNLREAIRAIDAALLDTIAACGDVNRNVMCTADPRTGAAHAAALDLARALTLHLTPRTGAYREIWLDGEKIEGGEPEAEPVYGATYLPRKFKTVVAVPPDNDVDVYAHDLGFVAIVEEGAVVGWTVTVGGGMGMTHGEPHTFPRTADLLGFCTTEQALAVAEAVVTVQRDWGDRSDRKQARLKYTIERRGLDAFRAEVERRIGFALGPPRPFAFDRTGDRYGWAKTAAGRWNLTLFVENGRVADRPGYGLRTALRGIAELLARGRSGADLRITPNQSLMICGLTRAVRRAVEAALAAQGVGNDHGGLRRNAVACVALPTCGLALAESERYLPSLVDALEDAARRVGLREDEIVIRMSGCPNGCSRPYLAEIGLVGRAPGLYHLYLGAAFDGSRLNRLYRRDLDHDGILAALTPLLEAYAAERLAGERFGDFVVRAGHVAPTRAGRDFHDPQTEGDSRP